MIPSEGPTVSGVVPDQTSVTARVDVSMPGAATDKAHFPALDGIRGAAAMGVFITHLGLLSGYITRTPSIGPYLARMDVGVSIFFMLSGFLLYRPIAAAHLGVGRPFDLRSYGRRRILRILPAYWLALTIVAFVMRAPGFEAPQSVVARYLLLHVYDSTQFVGGPIQQSWTLATEVSFYAFLPLWGYLMRRRRRDPDGQFRFEMAALAILFIVSWAGSTWLALIRVEGSTFAQLNIWLPFRISDFVPGMALAVLSVRMDDGGLPGAAWLRRNGTVIASWVVAVVAFWAISTRFGLPMFPTFTARQAYLVRIFYLVIAIGVVAPGVLAATRNRLVLTPFANRLMVYLGLISYGVYIWHEAWMELYFRWFDQQLLNTGVIRMGLFSLVTSVVVASASWFLFEKRIVDLGRNLDRRGRVTGSGGPEPVPTTD